MAQPAGAFPSALATRWRAALLALVSLSCVFSVVLSLVVFANPWPAPVQLSSDAGFVSGLPVAASDREGRVTALWYQGESLVASARSPGASWTAPERLGSSGGITRGGGEPARALSVMADDSILAVWPERPDGVWTLMAGSKAPGGTWQRAEVTRGAEAIWGIAAAAGSEGTAMVAWSAAPEDADGGGTLRFALRGPGGSWSQPQPPGAAPGWDVRLAAGRGGAYFAAWQFRNGDAFGVSASRFTPEGGWEPPTVNDDGARLGYSAQVAASATGDAMVVWARQGEPDDWISARTFDPPRGWSAPVNVARGAMSVRLLVGGDARGDFVVVWTEEVLGGFSYPTAVRSSRFTPQRGFEAPATLQDFDGVRPYATSLQVLEGGEAVVLVTAPSFVRVSTFSPEGGWAAASIAASTALGVPIRGATAVRTPAGQDHVFWLESCQAMTPGACMAGNVWVVSSADAGQVAISKGVAGVSGLGAFFAAVASVAAFSAGRTSPPRAGAAAPPPVGRT